MRIGRRVFCILLLAIFAVPLRAQSNDKTRLDMLIGGRTQRVTREGDEAWAYQWPAIYFAAHFTGNEVSLAFDDPNNNFNLLVDGRDFGVLKKPAKNSFAIRNLGPGEHTVRIEKRSETQYAVGAFKGFFVPEKANALPAPQADRAIEFIGDSLTVGYGNTSAFTECSEDELFEATDSQQGFGPLIAKQYGAAYQINAFSGLGLVRNFDGREHPKYHLPMLYPRALFDDPTPDESPWSPQIIVVGIGGNDFSSPIREDEPWKTQEDFVADYEKTYIAFMKDLHAKNPDAFLIMTWTGDRGPDTRRARNACSTHSRPTESSTSTGLCSRSWSGPAASIIRTCMTTRSSLKSSRPTSTCIPTSGGKNSLVKINSLGRWVVGVWTVIRMAKAR